jgi:hypothetical protein
MSDNKDVKSNPLKGGCPVPHDKRDAMAAAAAAGAAAPAVASSAATSAPVRADGVPDTEEREIMMPSLGGGCHRFRFVCSISLTVSLRLPFRLR